jgi:hypothetical protein
MIDEHLPESLRISPVWQQVKDMLVMAAETRKGHDVQTATTLLERALQDEGLANSKNRFCCVPTQFGKPAHLKAMNNETLLFVHLIGAAVTNVSFKCGLDFLWCGFHQIVRGKFRAIGTHEHNALGLRGIVPDVAPG